MDGTDIPDPGSKCALNAEADKIPIREGLVGGAAEKAGETQGGFPQRQVSCRNADLQVTRPLPLAVPPIAARNLVAKADRKGEI